MKRERLPTTRSSVTHRGQVASTRFYLTIGLYDDGRPGELFIVIGKEGSTVAGWADSFGIAISMLLQSGWSHKELATKFRGSQFEPRGYTQHPDLQEVSSIVDYIFRWMEVQFDR